MASEKGPVATEAPPFTPTASQARSSNASVEAIAAEAARATQTALSLKRQREAMPTSPSSVLPATFSSDLPLSPSKAARITGASSRHSPTPMTAAAALEDERRREEEQYRFQVSGESDNPAYRAQTALMSASALAMSRPQDDIQAGHQHEGPGETAREVADAGSAGGAAPVGQPAGAGDNGDATTTAEMAEAGVAEHPAMSEPEASPSVAAPTANMNEPESKVNDLSTDENVANLARLAEAGSHLDNSSGSMDLDAGNNAGAYGAQPPAPAPTDDKAMQSLSYPGILPSNPDMAASPARGMSMPMTSIAQAAPRSPNSKKHKCPYCETEFTRHHNLKSHLLTHSQEKPYVCVTCTMRFRRLHDLKRHSKLHTGEKPHICPKCDRKFARGDALARHSKGPGGCVGRRSSMGSYLGEEDPDGVSRLESDESAMAGVMYDNALNDPGMSEEDKRRLSSVPSIKAQHIEGGNQGQPFPHDMERGSASSTSHTPGTNISSAGIGAAGLSMFAQAGMTESPKALSPGLQTQDSANAARQRSPSLTSQFQQQQFGRHQTDRRTSPVPGYPTADPSKFAGTVVGEQAVTHQQQQQQQQGSDHSAQTQILASSVPGHNRTPSGNIQSGGSGDSANNNIFATDQGIWAYIHSLEDQVRMLSERVHAMETTERSHEEKITYLTTEVATLRAQIDLSHAANNGVHVNTGNNTIHNAVDNVADSATHDPAPNDGHDDASAKTN